MTRRVVSVVESHLELKPIITTSNEYNTSVGTCCIGKNFIILEYKRRAADVYAYAKFLNPI